MAILYQRGTIIEASQVPDQNGVNPKDRPVLLLVDFTDADTDAYGIAISTTFQPPLAATLIPLPYSAGQGICQTGLTAPSVAVCDWPVVVGKADILHRRGSCPSRQHASGPGSIAAPSTTTTLSIYPKRYSPFGQLTVPGSCDRLSSALDEHAEAWLLAAIEMAARIQ